MEIKRKRKGLVAPEGMKGALSLGDPNLQAIVGQLQSNIYALMDRLAAVEGRVGVESAAEEPVRPDVDVATPYEGLPSPEELAEPVFDEEKEFDHVTVDRSGVVIDGVERVEVEPGEYDRVMVDEYGRVTAGDEGGIPVYETFPPTPTTGYALIGIAGQIWGAGAEDTVWYPLYRLTDVVGTPGTTP